MSVRQGLLTLLRYGPKYGFQLRAEFEARTGSTWPLNVGQVYTTLARLERDGLVRSGDEGSHDTESDNSHVYYRLTQAGHQEVTRWFQTPVERGAPARDELAIKIALAVTVPEVDVAQILRHQRTHTLRVLQDYTRLKAKASEDKDLAWLLVLDSLVFQAEAEVRWLDHCAMRLARQPAAPPAQPTGLTPGQLLSQGADAPS